ncbi:hypothetical protein [uncultured Tissierella sp.]|uniref:hypothetical protein n=1 Tax=uncultured Tissierella sp. TaxID=448160 RepID=UPI00280404AA|nr:hypothetical protein [uncultured Tissierella sp.]MDU5083010.1 hypothetical protein [Bacillota bacterium]
MTSYLISCNLKNKDKNYENLYGKIKESSYDNAWWHYLDSTWIIKSDLSLSEITSNLTSTIDKNDCLLVIEVKNTYNGWLPKDAWDYLRDRIFS